mgnify:CR=1 FL=1
MGVKIREKPKGSGGYWAFIDHNGKRRAKKIGTDEKAALGIAKKIEAKLALGDFGVLEKTKSDKTFKTFSENFLEGYAKTALKESTYRGYQSILDKHLEPAFGKKPINEISRTDVKSFIFKKIKDGMSISRAKRIKVDKDADAGLPSAPPFHGVPPDLDTYRHRGHRRLDTKTYESKCSTCMWGCRMPVEIIVDHWNPTKKKYRFESSCYGPKSCQLYRAGATRKVPGRGGMTWEEEDWVDEDATSHRGPEN